MNNVKIIAVCGLVVFGLVILLSLVDLAPSYNTNVVLIEQGKINLNSSVDYGEINESRIIYDEIIVIAQDVASSHTYKLHDYDCTNFSMDLVDRLKGIGVKAECTAGNNWDFKDYTNHTWVSAWVNGTRIEIEATGGYIISYEQYKSYEVNWENYCW